jgi:hypothetical protein
MNRRPTSPLSLFHLPGIGVACLGLLAPLTLRAASPEEIAFFETKIRPVLAEKCYSCHSARSEKLKAGLQVDHVEHLLAGGDSGPSILAGKPDDSLLIETLRYGNPDLQMPPKGKLDPAQIADFGETPRRALGLASDRAPRRTGCEADRLGAL